MHAGEQLAAAAAASKEGEGGNHDFGAAAAAEPCFEVEGKYLEQQAELVQELYEVSNWFYEVGNLSR